MAQDIFAYIIHKDGVPDDTATELLAAARAIYPDAGVTAVLAGGGDGLQSACDAVAAAYPEVWKIDSPALAYPNAEVIRRALVNLIPKGSIVLLPHEHFGMDLAPGLSIKLDAAFVPDVVTIEGLEGETLKIIREEYSGQVSTHVSCNLSNGAVISVRAGVYAPEEGAAAGGTVTDKTGEAGELAETTRRYLETIEAEVGDVDITKSEVLVSVGRGIEDQDNLEIINELAAAMGGDVSCSRPIVDAKWLEKSRQVGTSGQTVKPKVYLALGISGSFQHMGGIKGNPFIVAVNKNPKAPIFQVADVGVVADILEFVPELTEKIEEAK